MTTLQKDSAYRSSEEYLGLVDEVADGIVEYRKKEAMNRIEGKYWLAETITRHPAYKKFGKGNAGFIENLTKDVSKHLGNGDARLSKSVVYDLIEVSQKFPDPNVAAAEIVKKGLNPFNWGSHLALIGRDVSISQETKCRRCKLHCPK